MSLFSVMNKEQVCALPEKYCNVGLDYAMTPDGPVVTHPKYSPLQWDDISKKWKVIKIAQVHG